MMIDERGEASGGAGLRCELDEEACSCRQAGGVPIGRYTQPLHG